MPLLTKVAEKGFSMIAEFLLQHGALVDTEAAVRKAVVGNVTHTTVMCSFCDAI